MQAGNDHMHNFLYRVCRQAGLGRIAANSLTGCAIAIVSAAVPAGLAMTGVLARRRYCGVAGVFCRLHRSSHRGCSRLLKDDSRAVCQLGSWFLRLQAYKVKKYPSECPKPSLALTLALNEVFFLRCSPHDQWFLHRHKGIAIGDPFHGAHSAGAVIARAHKHRIG